VQKIRPGLAVQERTADLKEPGAARIRAIIIPHPFLINALFFFALQIISLSGALHVSP